MQKVDAGDPPHHRRAVQRWRAAAEENSDKVRRWTAALLEWETIDAEQINDIMARQTAASAARTGVVHRRSAPTGPTARHAGPRSEGTGLNRKIPEDGCAACFRVPDGPPAVVLLQSSVRRRFRSPDRAPLVMGIVNLTPDSLSGDGLNGIRKVLRAAPRHARAWSRARRSSTSAPNRPAPGAPGAEVE